MTLPKLYIFDLDQTLWNGKQLYPDVKNILEILRRTGNFIYLASFNRRANDYLEYLKIKKYFHGGVFGYTPTVTKYDMVMECMIHLRGQYNGSLRGIEFYDDRMENVSCVHRTTSGLIRSVYIEDGLKWEHLNTSKSLSSPFLSARK